MAETLLTRLKKNLKEMPFYCKIIELIFCAITTALMAGSYRHIWSSIHHVALFHVAISGYILINAIVITGHLLDERLPKKMALIFAVMGAILCCAAGIVLFRDWDIYMSNLAHIYLEDGNQIFAAGCFAIAAAIVFAIDTYFTNKYG
ncbi:uncharacterized protein [Anoplolepis gracilipes]|uniref:uncharacterized protein n=1 Tax=Anoplolepis gracilipes TaxID=354296 RepID=UPI003BA2E27F